MSPASQLLERGKTPEALATVIAAALKFDFNGDKEAVEVQEYIKANGMDAAISHFTGAEAGSKLFELIKSKI